ncbi:MAG: hypothetical protein LJF04_06665, partial [Gemmatimonadetes bacterium]|nr:hypothetical protein [Gemmatimonadota bacterium]
MKRAPASVAAVAMGLAASMCVFAKPAAGQALARRDFGDDGGEVRFRSEVMERSVVADEPLVRTKRPYVVVHLAENRVY